MRSFPSSRAPASLVLAFGLALVLSGPAWADRDDAPVHGRAAIWHHLVATHDRDGDGAITPQEYDRGSERFQRLDEDGDGVLTERDFRGPARMDLYVARAVLMRCMQADRTPEVLTRMELCVAFHARDLDGDGRWSGLEFARVRAALRGRALGAPDMPRGVRPWPHVLAAVDEDGDGALDLPEVLRFFDAEDRSGTGRWDPPPRGGGPARVGPEVGALAPAFTRSSPDGTTEVSLDRLRGRLTALVFGSYT